jgi:hypothetical protein
MEETGGKRPDFWSSTLREIALDLEVAEARQLRDERTRRWHTWHTAALPKGKKFPSFKDFMPAEQPAPQSPGRRQQQTPEQQMAIAKQWLAGRKRR